MHRIPLALFLLFVLFPITLPASDIDQDGGIELTVSFEVDPDLDESVLAPIDDPLAEKHYCDALQEFSRALYATTEGAHWLRRVRFYQNTPFRDVRWHYLEDSSNFSVASYQKYMKIRERGTSDPDPYAPPAAAPDSIGRLINHEFGHYFYKLPDEYITRNASSEKLTGFCADGTYAVIGDEGIGVTCDEETPACGGSPCVYLAQCIEGDTIGADCTLDDDCGAGGICLGGDEARSDAPSKKRICLHPTDLSDDTGDDSLGVCLMAGGGLRKRWCDGGLDSNDDLVAGATHVFTLDDAQDYGVDVEFDLGLGAGIPDGADDNFNWVEHNCWDRASSIHIDLEGAHEIGVYPSLSDIEAEHGLVPDIKCEWLVDGLGDGAHALLLVDRSGSMNYIDLSTPPVAAVNLAAEGALYFYNQIDNGDWTGVSLYNTGTTPAESGGSPLDFEEKTGGINEIDPIVAFDFTDIAQAIDQAVADIDGAVGVPLSNRNIVIFSDGKSNQGGDPFLAAQNACDAGINVHTIAYGNADSDALAQLACGLDWVTGTELAGDAAFAEPDPLEIKTSIARMQHAISGEAELLEVRSLLEPVAVSKIEEVPFWVPEGTPGMTFSWLANHTCIIGESDVTCDPVLNMLVRVELEAPDGTIIDVPLSADGKAGVYRTVSVAGPRAGEWIARLDKTEPPINFIIPNEWDMRVPETRVSWVAFVDHPGIEGLASTSPRRAPTNFPIAIHAEMILGERMTGISAVATVTHEQHSWQVLLADNGLGADEAAGDGIYTRLWNPNGDLPDVTAGLYRVKVRMESTAGVSRLLPAHDADEDLPEGPIAAAQNAMVEAETSFHLSPGYGVTSHGDVNPGRIVLSCPNLERRTSTTVVGEAHGFALLGDDFRFSLGADVAIDNLTTNCVNCPAIGTDPIYSFVFDATPSSEAELGGRRLEIQVGEEVLESATTCRVCHSLACTEIELDQEPLVSGANARFKVTGANPGETVNLLVSGGGLGMGPCPPALGGLCLDLLPPVASPGNAAADLLGTAIIDLALPPVAPGTEVSTQAVAIRGAGGVDSVKSNANIDRVDP